MPCLADGGACALPVAADAPLALCERHLALAADWVQRHDGVTDLLPDPCRLCGSRLGVRYPSGWICAVCEWVVGQTVDGELPPVRVDVVYYLRLGERVKIGTTANPRQRLAALPYDELLAFERGDRAVEQRRHTQFAEYRIARSEWFAVNGVLAAHIDVLRAGVDDPWSLYALWRSQRLALES